MTEQTLKKQSLNHPSDHSSQESSGLFQGLVVAHAAVNGGMMANFGRHFAQCLVEEGAELHFFASHLPVFGWPPPVEDLERIGGQFHGLPVVESFAPLRDIWCIILMAVTLRRLRVQVLHTRSSLMGVIGRIAAKLAGVPIILHHQDDLYCRETQLSPLKRRIVAFIERCLAKLTDCSFFVSKAVLEDAITIGFPKDRCVLVGHDLNQVFQDAVNEVERKKEPALSYLRNIGVPENAQIVGCVGRLAHLKGIDLFLEAAERLAHDFPDWVFVIKGDGPMREFLSTTIKEKGLATKIFLFTDELVPQDLPALYRCFDLFALPTRREGFGMVFAEAMSMGVPVVGPRIAPITEVVPEDCGTLVTPENIDALTQALRGLMNNDDQRYQLAEKGRKYAMMTLGGQKAAKRVIDVYRELLRNK